MTDERTLDEWEAVAMSHRELKLTSEQLLALVSLARRGLESKGVDVEMSNAKTLKGTE